jgi:hypothetical protein
MVLKHRVFNSFTNFIALTGLKRSIIFEPTSVFLIQHQVAKPVSEIVATISDKSEADYCNYFKKAFAPDVLEC